MNSAAGRHIEQIDINGEKGVLVVSSNLTGQYWDGHLNYFSNIEAFESSLYVTPAAKDMYVGMSDGKWFDEEHVVVGTDEGNVCVLRLDGDFFVDPCCITQHHSFVTSVTVTADSKKCISASYDSFINIGAVTEASLLRKYPVRSATNCVCAHNESAYIFVSCGVDGSAFIWDLRESKPAKRLSFQPEEVGSCIAINDDKIGFGTERGQLIIKDIRNLAPLKTENNHKRAIRRIVFNPDRPSLIATCGEDGTVSVVDYNLLRTKTIYMDKRHTDFVTGAIWIPESNNLYTTSWDSTIKCHQIHDSS